jgi:chromosome segregation ATPase
MARGGLYKSDVQKARDTLIAQGKHPSVDAIRVALGNTGSKTTIHRYLKELESEEGQNFGAKVAISDALQDLVGKLAERLHQEAEALITAAKTQFEVQLRERTEALDLLRKEAESLRGQLQRTETDLQTERSTHGTTQINLTHSALSIAQLEERVAGLNTRLIEQETHAASLEEKHRHAREALEHYRTSVKDQREQEQRRHEHQVQELQVALRQANESLVAKNHELLQLNRDNARLAEQVAQHDKELRALRAEARQHKHELDELQPIAAAHQVLQSKWAAEQQTGEEQRNLLNAARTELVRERDARQLAETAATRSNARLEAIEETLKTLGNAANAAPQEPPRSRS